MVRLGIILNVAAGQHGPHSVAVGWLDALIKTRQIALDEDWLTLWGRRGLTVGGITDID